MTSRAATKSFRHAVTAMVGMAVLGTISATYFQTKNMEKKGNRMTNSNYLADTIKKQEAPVIPEYKMQEEVSLMVQKAREDSKQFEMKRIPRPENNSPRRRDVLQENDD